MEVFSLSSAFMVIWATGEDYKDSLYLIYPAMAPDSTKQLSKTAISLGVQAGKGWTRSFQVPTVVADDDDGGGGGGGGVEGI